MLTNNFRATIFTWKSNAEKYFFSSKHLHADMKYSRLDRNVCHNNKCHLMPYQICITKSDSVSIYRHIHKFENGRKKVSVKQSFESIFYYRLDTIIFPSLHPCFTNIIIAYIYSLLYVSICVSYNFLSIFNSHPYTPYYYFLYLSRENFKLLNFIPYKNIKNESN